MRIKSLWLEGACIGISVLTPVVAQGQSNSDVDKIERMQRQMEQLQERTQRQMQQLNAQIEALKNEVALAKKRSIDADTVQSAYGADVQRAPARTIPVKAPSFMDSIRITPGGFIATETSSRNRNEVADAGSDFNTGIPYPISPLFHENEFHMTARQSRITLLAEANISQWQLIQGYFEMDFLGAATTSNSRESNSYTPRIREGFLAYDDTTNGWHVLAGQAWSLLTQSTVGITPNKENIPLTIDASYAVGFNWTRNPQLRIVKDFGSTLSLGVSAESPQVVFQSPSSTVPDGVVINFQNQGQGSGLMNTTTNYSADTLPDFIEKLAWDPGWGHYEVIGMQRFFTDRVQECNLADLACPNTVAPFNEPLGPATNHTTNGWGIGGSVLLPVWPKLLDVQGSILYGNGIGRYASGQLPDVTIAPDGSLTALRELQSMIGAVLHIMPDLDLYSYAGVERAAASYTVNTNGISGVNIGYGNPFYSNAACLLENYGGPFTPAVGGNVVTASESNGTCAVNTRQLAEITAGFWYNLYRGLWGRVAFGMQLEYIHRDVFSASAAVAAKNGFAALPAANLAPATDIGIIMSSLRFYF